MNAWATLTGLLILLPTLAGCGQLGYYAHLGKGGFELVTRGERVERLLGDPGTAEELRTRLRFAGELLEFAEADLGLPVGKKYRKYLDLERPFVVWTVVATPEFSLEPEVRCFPIAGCVGYRGFFLPAKAEGFADRLRARGLDVSVGGVRAFSSLGWFGDPLLNTFLFDGDRQLAGLLFHELAHGIVYAKDDTAFNESFATAVERIGVRRWLEAGKDAEEQVADYRLATEELDETYARIGRFRTRLESLYSRAEATLPPAEMRAQKAEIFAELQRDLVAGDPERTSAFAGWIGQDLNNANLASIGFYGERLPAFERLYSAVGEELAGFYDSARCLVDLRAEERSRRLENESWGDCILGGS